DGPATVAADPDRGPLGWAWSADVERREDHIGCDRGDREVVERDRRQCLAREQRPDLARGPASPAGADLEEVVGDQGLEPAVDPGAVAVGESGLVPEEQVADVGGVRGGR